MLTLSSTAVMRKAGWTGHGRNLTIRMVFMEVG
jgi:hypothetical protein